MFLSSMLFVTCITSKTDVPGIKDGKRNPKGKIGTVAIIGDGLFTITTLVLGVLGAFSVLSIPKSVTYTLISIEGVIACSWVFMAATSKGDVFGLAKRLLTGDPVNSL